MNRNRFITPPPPFNNEIPTNAMNYPTTIPRFNVWQSSLSSSQNMQPGYPVAKKNYCSTCDMWTSEPYNNHQISPAHLAKKTAQRLNQNYQPTYSNTNNSANNNNANNITNNTSNSKRKYKRSNRRNNRNKQVSGENVDTNESNLNDGHNNETVLPDERSDDKPQAIVSSQSKELDKKLNITKNRGQEMLIPVNGMFCALCEIFFPNKDVAENEHCSSQAHCEAYEKLLKRVQESKSDKRSIEKSTEESVNDSKRLKLKENKDRDFRMLSLLPTTTENEKKSDQKKDIPPTGKESDEVDRNSTNEFNAPDFSLDFPDDMEDYDEGDVHNNSEMYSPTETRKVCVISKDA